MGKQLLELGLLLGGIDVDLGQRVPRTSFCTAAGYFARWPLTASARRLERAGEAERAVTSSEAERFVVRLLEGCQQPVDFDRPGRSQRLGQTAELFRGEFGSCQDVGRGGAAGDRLGARELAEQKGEELLIRFAQASGHGGQCAQAKLVGLLGVGGDSEQGR